MGEIEDRPEDEAVREALYNLADAIENARPGDRSELDRLYAVLFTDYQKMYAFFSTYILVG